MHAGGRSSATEASEVPLQSPGSCECHCRSHGRSLTSAEVLLTLTFKKHAVMWSIAMFGFAVRQGWAFAHRLQGSSILKLCLESRRVSFLLRSGTLCCRTLWEAGTLHCALFHFLHNAVRCTQQAWLPCVFTLRVSKQSLQQKGAAPKKPQALQALGKMLMHAARLQFGQSFEPCSVLFCVLATAANKKAAAIVLESQVRLQELISK